LVARACLKVRKSNWRFFISLCIRRPFAAPDPATRGFAGLSGVGPPKL
jgi:hypothetical protein